MEGVNDRYSLSFAGAKDRRGKTGEPVMDMHKVRPEFLQYAA
jgi:hypothetical protein